MSVISKLSLAARHAFRLISSSNNFQQFQRIRIALSAFLSLESMLIVDRPQTRLIGLLLFSIAAVVFSVIYIPSQNLRSIKATRRPSVSAISALSKFLIPTCSIWPQEYIDLTRSAEEKSEMKRISIPLKTFFRDIRQGRLELRSPSTDLPLFIKGDLVLDGWNLDLNLTLNDKTNVLMWILSDELTMFPDETYPELNKLSGDDGHPSPERAVVTDYYLQYAVEASQAAGYMRPSMAYGKTIKSRKLSLNHINSWPSLDTIPRALTETFIRSSQQMITAMPSTHALSILSFTTTETPVSPFNKLFALVSLSFSRAPDKDINLPDDVSSRIPSRIPSRRTPAPLFTRLPHVLALLTSGPHALQVLALSNASATYARALDDYATEIEVDDIARRGFIKRVGVQRWREERLHARWEAALLRTGIITRWIVILGKNE